MTEIRATVQARKIHSWFVKFIYFTFIFPRICPIYHMCIFLSWSCQFLLYRNVKKILNRCASTTFSCALFPRNEITRSRWWSSSRYGALSTFRANIRIADFRFRPNYSHWIIHFDPIAGFQRTRTEYRATVVHVAFFYRLPRGSHARYTLARVEHAWSSDAAA